MLLQEVTIKKSQVCLNLHELQVMIQMLCVSSALTGLQECEQGNVQVKK